MLKKAVEKALNEQVNHEFWSAYMYLSMSAYFEQMSLPGFANWMRVQFQEETAHAEKIFDYIHERGGTVELLPIKDVPNKWNGILDAFEETLKHEQKVTGLINDLMDIALEERDHATTSWLQWFVDEQVEEESNVDEIINHLKLIDGKGHGLFMMDKEYRTRSFDGLDAGA